MTRTTEEWLTNVNPKLTGDAYRIAQEFATLTEEVLSFNIPPSAERSAGMRKLLEAKDCFVRAAVPDEQLKAEETSSQKFSERYGYSKPDDGDLVGRD